MGRRLDEWLVKMAADELRRAAKKAAPPKAAPPPKAPPPIDVSKLGEFTARVMEEGGATERMLAPSLTREQGIAKYLATPGGRMIHQFNLDARRRGEAGIPAPAPVVKAAPQSTVSKAVREKAGTLEKRILAEQDQFEREALLEQHRALFPQSNE